MSEIWKRWEGQVVDHKYQLRQFLGSTDHSAAFYAEFRDPESRKATVKFLSADVPHAEQILADWKSAQQLSHPHLIRIYAVGRCKIEEMELLYAAMEYAEENLAEFLPHRALTTDEARDMLTAVVDVLGYLHTKKLTHGHIKPSNILAIGDLLKVASDTIQPLNELREMRRERDAYDAPEIPSLPYTPAADIWSLGVTLVEALAQQPAVLPFDENADPVIPPIVHEPFLDIARHALRRNAKLRWTSAEIAARLDPAAASGAPDPEKSPAVPEKTAVDTAPEKAAVAIASTSSATSSAPSAVAAAAPPSSATPTAPSSKSVAVSPLSVPLSKEPAIPLSKQPTVPDPTAVARPPMPLPPLPREPASSKPRQAIVLPNYVVPLIAAVVVLVAIIALPKILHRSTESAASNSTASAPPATTTTPGPAAANPRSSTSQPQPMAKPKPPALPKSLPSGSAKPAASVTSAQASTTTPTIPPAPAPESATLRSPDTTISPSPKTASALPGRGEVLDQVMPRPGSAAMATIQGTVRVVVKVQVDAAGNVSQSLLESPGPSKYFANLAVEAAHGWVFNSPEVDGRSVPSEWLIRFEFTPSGVRAYPRQISP